MKIKIIILFILLIFFLGNCDSDNAVVKGEVVDSNGEPVENLQISLLYENKKIKETMTDSNGSFMFAELEGDNLYIIYFRTNNKEYTRAVYVSDSGWMISCTNSYSNERFVI